MALKSFLKAGHPPTLFAAFLYFDVSFMIWVLLGPLAVQISADLGLNAAQKGLMVATPVLAGAFLRVPAGLLADRIGPKGAGVTGQLIVLAGLVWVALRGLHSFGEVLGFGVVLGVAGASFAVALPLASRWYPPEHQGTALGIAGAGNSGTVLASLFAPTLAARVGWSHALGLAAIPAALTLLVFLLLARNSPDRPAPKSHRRLPRRARPRGRLDLHGPLWRDLRRLRGPGRVAADLLPHRVRLQPGHGRDPHRRLRVRRLAVPARGRLSRRSARRDQDPDAQLRRGGPGARRSSRSGRCRRSWRSPC